MNRKTNHLEEHNRYIYMPDIYIYIYKYKCIYTYIFSHTYTSKRTYAYVHVHTCSSTCTRICTYTRMNIYIHICAFVYQGREQRTDIGVCIHTDTYTSTYILSKMFVMKTINDSDSNHRTRVDFVYTKIHVFMSQSQGRGAAH